MDTNEMLANAGLKCTKQRLAVLNVLAAAVTPMRAEDIFDKAGITALSTIYRTLDRLMDSNIIVKTTIPGSDGVFYELTANEHKHYAVCLGCHEMRFIETCPMHDVRIDGFEVTGHKLEIYGYCKKCRENNGKG